MSQWMDISQPMHSDMPVWPGDPRLRVRPIARIGQDGAKSNVSEWSFSSHAGTHVDPPLHFLPNGAGVDQLDLNVLCGPCRVLDLTHIAGHITAEDLRKGAVSGEERLLLKTRNSLRRDGGFHQDFTALAADAGEWLVGRGVRLVGTDGPSIEAFDAVDFAVHHTLLKNGVIVVENLALAGIEPGRYEMVCAPLKWEDADGAPARTLLRPIGGAP